MFLCCWKRELLILKASLPLGIVKVGIFKRVKFHIIHRVKIACKETIFAMESILRFDRTETRKKLHKGTLVQIHLMLKFYSICLEDSGFLPSFV